MEVIRAILPQLSLLVLIMVIAVGFVKKINIGFFSIGAAFLLALLGMAVELQIKTEEYNAETKEQEIDKLTTALECIRYGLTRQEILTYLGGESK